MAALRLHQVRGTCAQLVALMSFAALGACGGSVEHADPASATTPTPSRCVPAGAAPGRLVAEANHRASSLVPRGQDIWFLWTDIRVSRADVALRKIAVRPGSRPLDVVADGVFAVGSRSGGSPGESFGFLGQRVVHHGIASDGTKSGTFQTGVIVFDPAVGASRFLTTPRPLSVVSSLVVGSTGVAWATTQQSSAIGQSAVTVWHDGAAPAEIATMENDPHLVTDGENVHYTRVRKRGAGGAVVEVTFETAALAGGAPRVVRTFPAGAAVTFALEAADASGLVYSRRRPGEALTLFDTSSGDDRLITTSPRLDRQLVLDPLSIYAVDAQNARTLVRVDRSGAPDRAEGADVEEIATRPSPITDLAVDDCNIYWIEDGAVMAMQKRK